MVSPVTPFFLYRTQRTMANKLSQYRYLPMIHCSFFLIRQTQQLSLLLQSITFPCSWCNNLFIYTSIFLSIFLFVFESVSKAHSLNIRSARASMSSSILINISKKHFLLSSNAGIVNWSNCDCPNSAKNEKKEYDCSKFRLGHFG